MHSTKDRYVLMIEPVGAASKPVIDELSIGFRAVFDKAVVGQTYKGCHTCSCGAYSSNHDLILPTGQLTNTLAAHYLECHRSDVPECEIIKIGEIIRAPVLDNKLKKLNAGGYDTKDNENILRTSPEKLKEKLKEDKWLLIAILEFLMFQNIKAYLCRYRKYFTTLKWSSPKLPIVIKG